MPKLSALRALPLAALMLAACGVKKNTTDVSPGVRFAATCPNVVQVYGTRSDVPSDYYEIAFIEAEGNSIYTTDNQLQEQIKIGAAKVGATGVIANPVEQSKTTVKVLGEAVGAKSATQKASGLAIYSPAEKDRVRQVCGG